MVRIHSSRIKTMTVDMKKRIISVLILIIGTVPALSQEAEIVNVTLSDVQIEALTPKTIIQKAIGNLFKMTKKTPISFYGNAQHIQIMESAGSVIQLSREYGYFFEMGYNEKRDDFDCGWDINFVPVYNARSLRYDTSGNEVLTENSESAGQVTSKNWFDARWKYIFDIIRLIYLYGPVYSRNCSDYVFALTADSGDSYTFSFESSDRYPRKNPLYAKGQLEIDAASMKLKSIRIDNMGIHYAGKYSLHKHMLKKYPDPHDSRILQDCVDCDFEVNGFGEISYALIHVLWSPTNKQYYKGGCGNQPRANVAGTDFVVTECWKSDLFDFESLPDSTIQKLHIRKPANASEARKWAVLTVFTLGRCPEHNTYNPEATDRIEWALDVSDAERQLNQKMPIKDQYRMQSTDFYSSVEEDVNKSAASGLDDDDTTELHNLLGMCHELIRNYLFDDPLRQ